MDEECSEDKSLLRGQMGKWRTSQVLRARWATSFLHIEEKHRMVDYLLSSAEGENLDVSIRNADRALSLLTAGIISSNQWIKRCFLRLVWAHGPTHQLYGFIETLSKKNQWQTDEDTWSVELKNPTLLQSCASWKDRIKQYGFDTSRKIIIYGIHMHMWNLIVGLHVFSVCGAVKHSLELCSGPSSQAG